MTLGSRQLLGQQSEQLAAEFLVSKDYKIIARNVRTKLGEIDILAFHQETIVVVEVKALTHASTFQPLDKIDSKKQRKLLLLAQEVAAKYPGRNIQIDAVTLYWNQQKEPVITHFKSIL